VLRPPFDAPSIPALVLQIANSKYEDLPNEKSELYSKELRSLIKRMLTTDPKTRPSI